METQRNTYFVDLSEYTERMGSKRIDRIKWLFRHADLSRPTAENWLDGRPVGVTFDKLYDVTNALECTPNDIIKVGVIS